jgi:hypothetical protein
MQKKIQASRYVECSAKSQIGLDALFKEVLTVKKPKGSFEVWRIPQRKK